MNASIQLNRQLRYWFITLLLASFAVVQNVQAQPNEADAIGNVAEENDAIPDLGSDVEAVIGQAAKTPNKRVINFNIKKPLQCAGGDVILRGNVLVTFKQIQVGLVQPFSLKLEGFTGTAKIGNRKLVAKNLRFTRPFNTGKLNGHGEGDFSFEFNVTGPGLPGGSPLRFPLGERQSTRCGLTESGSCASPLAHT